MISAGGMRDEVLIRNVIKGFLSNALSTFIHTDNTFFFFIFKIVFKDYILLFTEGMRGVQELLLLLLMLEVLH